MLSNGHMVLSAVTADASFSIRTHPSLAGGMFFSFPHGGIAYVSEPYQMFFCAS